MSVCSNRSHTFYGNHSSPSTASGEWSPDLQDRNYGHSVAQSRPSLYNEYYLPPMLEQPSTTSLSYNLNETESFNSPPSPRYQPNPPPGFTIPQKHNIPILSNSPSPAPPNVSSPLRLSGHQMNQPFISNSLSQSNLQPPYSHQHIPSEVQLFMQAAAAAAVLEQRQRFDQQMMYDQQMRQQVLQTYLPYLYSQSISTPSIPFADFSMMNTLFDPTVMTTALNMPTTPMPLSVVNISEVPASPPSSPMPNTRAALTTSPPPDDSCVPSAASMDQIKPVDKVNSDAAIQVGSGISETPVFVETTKLKQLSNPYNLFILKVLVLQQKCIEM
uniref:Uncharacterized protein n=1 Tax=Timema monikensis TaxID=170555 RepID=A0A7R9E2N6_9NEOP|nr:unnamed protein product [Timema monikensis]